MFPYTLHEKTQRQVCRVAFGIACLAPTLCVAMYVISLRLPWHVAAYEENASQRAGLIVSFADVTHPKPGLTLYHDAKIADAETGDVVASARLVEVAQHEGRQVLLLSQPEVAAGRLDLLWQFVDQRILRAQAGGEQFEIVCGEVTLQSKAGDSQTLTGVIVRVEHSPTNPNVLVTYRVAGHDMHEPAQIRISRDRKSPVAVTRFEWHTGGAALPCNVFAERFAWLDKLGTGCTFRGQVWATHFTDGWRGELTGMLESIDLDELVSSQFPHKLSGIASVTFRRLTFAEGRITAADGAFRAGPGIVGQGLIVAAEESLGVDFQEKSERSAATTDLRRYEKMGGVIRIQADGLSLFGDCADEPPQTLLKLADGSNATLGAESIAAASLVKLLVPATDFHVPATEQTRQLISALPLPTAAHAADDKTPRGHLKLQAPQEENRN